MRSLPDTQKFDSSIPFGAKTDATENGAAVATGWESDSRAFVVPLGPWTDGSHSFTFEGRDGAAAFAAIPKEDLAPYGAAVLEADGLTLLVDDDTRAGKWLHVGYIGTLEDLRVVLVTTGSTTGLVAGAGVQSANLRNVGAHHNQ